MALDGTLHVENNQPWMVFCHEWVQIGDGTMNAVRLADDLTKPVGVPILLFRASDAPWCRPIQPGKYVTDGPCFDRLKSGPLLMLWSSFGERGYSVGVARSINGTIQGPWTQNRQPLYEGGGHCMIFQSLEGRPMLVLHGPNDSPKERAKFFDVREEQDTVRLQAVGWQDLSSASTKRFGRGRQDGSQVFLEPCSFAQPDPADDHLVYRAGTHAGSCDRRARRIAS